MSLLLVLALVGCGSSNYAILSATASQAEVAKGETVTVTVEVGKTEGRQQVQGTDTLIVSVAAPPGITVTPVVRSYEEEQPDGSLKIVMRPGGNLPRVFEFELTVGPEAEAGEQTVTIHLQANGEDTTKDLTLTVK